MSFNGRREGLGRSYVHVSADERGTSLLTVAFKVALNISMKNWALVSWKEDDVEGSEEGSRHMRKMGMKR